MLFAAVFISRVNNCSSNSPHPFGRDVKEVNFIEMLGFLNVLTETTPGVAFAERKS